ncbi:(deoxy)nucleoside triphosphate pyrophosphohydrolase [Gemmatimonas sp.]|uniref:(deoxy)nucleoside triphosphate pyrophosphohydrolase n=1 Tax=Gemmatimonas sp. TaxID=1962908 RepID=UPI003983705C
MPDHLIRVIAAVVRDGDRFLVCRRPAHKRHGGLWEFPGGKCKDGESDQHAITRELAEELGVQVTAVGDALFSASDPNSPYLIVFMPVEIHGHPVCLEHAAIAWASTPELAAYALAPSDDRFVSFLGHVE